MPILLFILLCIGFSHRADAVEIYSAGKHFNSMEDYQKLNQGGVPLTAAVPISEVTPAPVLSPGEQKMNKASYDDAVYHVVVGFEQSWKNPKPRFITGTKELESAIEGAMKGQQEPTLLISDSKKMRIMTYDPAKQKFVEEKSAGVDKAVKK